MRRRVLGVLAVALVAVPAGGCARPSDGVKEPPGVVLPTSRTMVAQWSDEGGFVPPGWLLVRAPRLAVYSDGTAVADADRTLVLTSTEVNRLVADLREGLAGLPATVQPDGGIQVTDVPDAILSVLEADGSIRSVKAYGLGIQDGYPDRLNKSGDLLNSLAERVRRDGKPFTSDRVRLAVEPRSEGTGTAWPTAVALPPPPKNDYSGSSYDLGGADAVAVRKTWPDSVTEGKAWPTVRLPSGSLVAVAWRYLLPHE